MHIYSGTSDGENISKFRIYVEFIPYNIGMITHRIGRISEVILPQKGKLNNTLIDTAMGLSRQYISKAIDSLLLALLGLWKVGSSIRLREQSLLPCYRVT